MEVRLVWILVLLVPGAVRAGEKRAAPVVLRYLGNEGFALEAAGLSVLFDALQTVGTEAHGDLPESVFAQMLARKKPFQKVSLILSSHPHADHFVPSVVSRFLAKHAESMVAGPGELLSLLEDEPGYADFRARLREVQVGPGRGTDLEIDGLQVRFIELPHLAFELYRVRVVAHLVRVGGVSVLHIGDAELSAERLGQLGLESEKIDVAILPYWVFSKPGALGLVEKYIRPKKIVSMRLPQGSLKEAEQKVSDASPGAVVLTRSMEVTRL